jgi:hypothetical protein
VYVARKHCPYVQSAPLIIYTLVTRSLNSRYKIIIPVTNTTALYSRQTKIKGQKKKNSVHTAEAAK